MLGLLLFEGGYILLYCGTPTFWQRGLWDSCFQNPSERSDKYVGVCSANLISFALNIPWKWNNLVSLRPNYFIFIWYLKQGTGRGFKWTPWRLEPLWVFQCPSNEHLKKRFCREVNKYRIRMISHFFYSQNILSKLMIESKKNLAFKKNRHFSKTKMSIVFLFLEEIHCCSSVFCLEIQEN